LHLNFNPVKDFDKSLFSESELEIMQIVLDKFKSKPTEIIENISHKELGWIENEKANQ